MDILVEVFLPVSVAIIMLSLGIGLTPADFRRVVERGWAFGIGALCQLLVIPVFAFIVIQIFGFTGAIAAGIMLLSFCPGGVTTNVLTRLAHGDVALSVSLTALISLLSMVTVPFCVGWAVIHFMGSDVPEFSVTEISITMFLITTFPVAIGVALRHTAPSFADRAEPKLHVLAGVLFMVIVVAAIATNWDLLVANLSALGPALALLSITTMFAGRFIAKVFGLSWAEQKTVAVEVGIQNGTLGITLAPIIAGVATGIPEIGLPAGIYSIIMYITGIPIVLWLRSRRRDG